MAAYSSIQYIPYVLLREQDGGDEEQLDGAEDIFHFKSERNDRMQKRKAWE